MSKKDKKCCGKKKDKKCCGKKSDEKKSKKSSCCESLSLVKWDYDSLPEEWKTANPNKFEGKHFACFGEITKMSGHSLCLEMETGKPYVLHTNELIELTEEEL